MSTINKWRPLRIRDMTRTSDQNTWWHRLSVCTVSRFQFDYFLEIQITKAYLLFLGREGGTFVKICSSNYFCTDNSAKRHHGIPPQSCTFWYVTRTPVTSLKNLCFNIQLKWMYEPRILLINAKSPVQLLSVPPSVYAYVAKLVLLSLLCYESFGTWQRRLKKSYP